jgi:hypothetical protein
MTPATDPLDRLVVDEGDINRDLLADVLADKVVVDPKAGTFAFKHRVREQLGNMNIVLTALLAQKVLALLGADVNERLQPIDLETKTGIRGGTLRPILKRLADSRTVRRETDGYFVPNYALEDIANLLRQ